MRSVGGYEVQRVSLPHLEDHCGYPVIDGMHIHHVFNKIVPYDEAYTVRILSVYSLSTEKTMYMLFDFPVYFD